MRPNFSWGWGKGLSSQDPRPQFTGATYRRARVFTVLLFPARLRCPCSASWWTRKRSAALSSSSRCWRTSWKIKRCLEACFQLWRIIGRRPATRTADRLNWPPFLSWQHAVSAIGALCSPFLGLTSPTERTVPRSSSTALVVGGIWRGRSGWWRGLGFQHGLRVGWPGPFAVLMLRPSGTLHQTKRCPTVFAGNKTNRKRKPPGLLDGRNGPTVCLSMFFACAPKDAIPFHSVVFTSVAKRHWHFHLERETWKKAQGGSDSPPRRVLSRPILSGGRSQQHQFPQ